MIIIKENGRMRQTIKKTVALLLSLVMILGISITAVSATETEEPTKTINFDDSWTVLKDSENTPSTVTKKDGVLTIGMKANSSRYDCVVGGAIDDIAVSETTELTIDFGMSTYADVARYIYFDESFSYGFTVLKTSAVVSSNFVSDTSTTFKYSDNGITTETKEYSTNHTTTYYRVILKADTQTLHLYVLSTGGWVKVAETGGYTIPDNGKLYLVFGGRNHATKARNAIFSEVKIYKGDLMKETKVEVNDIDGTEEKTVIGVNYTLPTLDKLAGRVAGWRVNDEETLTPAGTVISTTGLEKITEVYDKVMSKTWVQFKTNAEDATKKDIRIVGAIDTLDYVELGYKVVVTAGDQELYNDNITITSVYSSLTETYSANESKDITVKDLGYSDGYMVSFAIKGIKGEITVTLTPSQTTGLGTTTGEEISFTVNVDTETVN